MTMKNSLFTTLIPALTLDAGQARQGGGLADSLPRAS